MSGESELLAARGQMGLSLGFHIVFASLGVGMPALLLFAEWRANRTGDPVWKSLARRWSKAFAVLFAVGAVSGTVLSFELGLLWPPFMGRFGAAIGMPFMLEAYAFFLEAIFLGIYLYGWDRLSPRAHWLCAWPLAVSGALSATFVITVNAWMNTPVAFTLDASGRIASVDPLSALRAPAAAPEVVHMLLAAYVATGLSVAAVYAAGMLRGRRDLAHRLGLAVGLSLGLGLAPLQLVAGDWAARMVAHTQPTKLAAMEGEWRTESHAPLRIGGLPEAAPEKTPYAIEIPGGLSWLAYGDADATVRGLQSVPRDLRPNALVVHIAFQLMVAIGTALALFAVAVGAFAFLRRRLPTSPTFLWITVASGPSAFLAIEAGWTVTEVGRQPWIVYGVLRTADAVTRAPGLAESFLVALAIYAALATGAILVLLHLARRTRRGAGETHD